MAKSKPRFRVGQLVLCTCICEWVKIAQIYQGRTSPKGPLRNMYVISWEYGKSTTAVEEVLRALTAREIGASRPARKGRASS